MNRTSVRIGSIPLWAAMLFGCVSSNDAPVAGPKSERAINSPAVVGRVEVDLRSNGDLLSAHLKNGGDSPFGVSSGYAIAGTGGGNVLPIVVSRLGQVVPPCNPVDHMSVYWRAATLRPGETVEIWSGPASWFQSAHCLSDGEYALVMAYQTPKGSLYFSNQLPLTVKGETARVGHSPH
jgi:hypothetical protein